MNSVVGIIGAMLIALGWIPETLKVIKDRKSRLDWKFGVLYFAGSAMLTVYSVQINNLIFTLLNSFVMILEVIALFYSIKKY